MLIGIVYSLLPYGGHPTGWTNPYVLAAIFGGIVILVLFTWVETKVPQPMFRLSLFRIRGSPQATSPGCSAPSAGAACWRSRSRGTATRRS